LLERVRARKSVILHASGRYARNGRKWREVYFEEVRTGDLAGEADVRNRDLLALTISSGFLFAREMLFKRF